MKLKPQKKQKMKNQNLGFQINRVGRKRKIFWI